MIGFVGPASWSSQFSRLPPSCCLLPTVLVFFSLTQQLLNMLCEDVDFDVNTITRSDDAQSRHRQRMGNEHDREGIGPDVDQRQANAVDGDGTLGYEQGGPGRIDFECKEFPLSLLASVAERGGRIDMALNKMSSQAVADLECPLEIDAIAGFPVSEVGSVEGFRAGLDVERFARGRDDGQTATADGHALAEFEGVVHREDRAM